MTDKEKSLREVLDEKMAAVIKAGADRQYHVDLYAWAKEQADLLRGRAANKIDWDNLAEEIESMGRSERYEIEARLENLLLHLLKWRFQPEGRCGSWRGSIVEARHRLEKVLRDNPSLKSLPSEYLPEAYSFARTKALEETGLLALPETCPWPLDEVLSGRAAME